MASGFGILGRQQHGEKIAVVFTLYSPLRDFVINQSVDDAKRAIQASIRGSR